LLGISHENVRKHVIAILLDEIRGLNDWGQYSDRLTDVISILISTYKFSRVSFRKETRKIKTQFFKDNNIKKEDFLRKVFEKIELLDETFLINEINLEKIKNSRQIPKKIKIIVFKRDKGKCVICKKNVGGLLYKINYDHDFPFSKKGTSLTPENVRLLCVRCNLKKSNKII
jgi:hypothetical protein